MKKKILRELSKSQKNISEIFETNEMVGTTAKENLRETENKCKKEKKKNGSNNISN